MSRSPAQARSHSRLPNQRWLIAPAQPDRALQLAQTTHLPPLLTQVLINRGWDTPEAARTFLDPELQQLPSPLEEFPDLPIALDLLLYAIGNYQPIAICGDYDADGMTSTALLLRALRYMGAVVDYAIPSRMQEGYGMNRRIVEEFYSEGVGLILTVDNGIAAHEPIARARELGLTVIVTDHHDLPETLPDANAILNPKLIAEDSPYRGIAGVGVAYVLAICLAQCLRKTQDLTTPLLELFTLGTIADLAPLTGVNRRWVRRGLKLLPKSRLPGVQALIQVAGLSQEKELKPEAIGFRLGPRINAIGRIADPQIVIELLTTEDDGQALELAMKCEQVNQLRQRLCELIEQEAIDWCEQCQFNGQQERVLVVVQPEWHHGVIGIVASRLVERYGVPVFIGTYEDEAQTHIRGSARGIPEFNVFEALQFCGDVLGKYGGHRAAGGFSLSAENLAEFRSRLRLYAHGQLQPEHLKPLVKIDVEANFADLTLLLHNQMDILHPCGIENPDPVFWTANVRVLDQQTIGRDKSHLKLTLTQSAPDTASSAPSPTAPIFKAIAWRWGEYFPLPERLDIAYRLKLNEWNGVKSVELELVGVRLAAVDKGELPRFASLQRSEQPVALANLEIEDLEIEDLEIEDLEIQPTASARQPQDTQPAPSIAAPTPPESNSEGNLDPLELDLLENDRPLTRVGFYYNKRKYTVSVVQMGQTRELRIRNGDGQVLAIQPHQRRGLLGKRREDAEAIDLSHPHYFNLMRAALGALELAEKDQLLQEKDRLLAEKDQQIAALQQQLNQISETKPSETKPSETKPSEILVVPLPLPIEPNLEPQTPLQPEECKQLLKQQLGTAWKKLNPHSQRDLVSSYQQYHSLRAEAFTAPIVDYSDAGHRLGLAVEREVVQPFFKQLHQHLLNTLGSNEIGGIALKARKKYALHCLPPLLVAQWLAFQPDCLQDSHPPTATAELYCPMPSDLLPCPVSTIAPTDRAIVQAFLLQWNHPIAKWLFQGEAASVLAQIDQLRTIAANHDALLYEWQFQELQKLVLGQDNQPGLFQTIYS